MRRVSRLLGVLALVVGATTALAEAASAPPRVIAALGTSLTQDGHWQEPLAEMLTVCLGQPVTVLDFGESGATSQEGLAHVADVMAHRPDVVLIEFAINDASLHRFMSTDASVANIDQIVQEIRVRRPEVRVYIQLMNPVAGLRGWARPFLGNYNAAHVELAQRLGIGIIDHRPTWARLSDQQLAQVVPDGVHPTAEAGRTIVAPGIAKAICP